MGSSLESDQNSESTHQSERAGELQTDIIARERDKIFNLTRVLPVMRESSHVTDNLVLQDLLDRQKQIEAKLEVLQSTLQEMFEEVKLRLLK